MGEKALVESQFADATALIEKLDSAGAAPTLAVWYFYDDAAEWRLIIAGPAFDGLLNKQQEVAYRKVVDAMEGLNLSSLTISDIKLVASNSALPQALRLLIQTLGSGSTRAHFTDTTLNGLFIKEMVILRSM